MKNSKTLEQRIREVADKMEGKYFETVPHSVFVEWDATWDIAEEIDPEWGCPCNADSSDEEIEACILHRECVCDEVYQENIKQYNTEHYEWAKIDRIVEVSVDDILESDPAIYNIVTPGDLKKTIRGILEDKEGRAGLIQDVKDEANHHLYEEYYGPFGLYHRGEGPTVDEVLRCAEPELDQILECGVDYGPLSCLAEDGKDSGYTVESAVRKGLVDNWSYHYAEAAKAEYWNKKEQN